jgi:diguanylate cyclase (GGDEF)-like protein
VAKTLQQFLKSTRLPTLPEVAVKVLEIARQPDPDLAELAQVIRMDPAIAARLMKAANSALMGMKSPAASIEVAVARLGSTTVRTVILGMCLANYQDESVLELRPWYRRLWREMLFQAVAADALAEHQSARVESADWFLSGLLQDLGRLAMLTIEGESYLDNVLDAHDDRTQLQREQDYFGFTHVDVTVGLCQRWNLDSDMTDAIAVHHQVPHQIAPLRFASSDLLPIGLITATYCVEYIEEISGNLERSRDQIERLLLQVFAFQPDQVSQLLEDIDARVGEFATLFSIDIGQVPSRNEILAEAEEILEQIALEQQLLLVEIATKSSGTKTPQDRSRWRDPVTGLFNQTYLQEGCSKLHDAAHRNHEPTGMLLIRLNGHSQFCRSKSKEAADHFVKHVATILHRSLRFSDCLVRATDDRFAVVMSDVNLDMLVLAADQLSQSIMKACHENPDWTNLSCSIGVLLHLPAAKPVKPQRLLSEVERAMNNATRQAPGSTSVVVVQNGKVLAGNTFAAAEKEQQAVKA